MMGDAINLRDAPGRFLSDDWLRLVQLKGSESGAIEALAPEPGLIGYLRGELIAEGEGSAEVQAAEEASKLAQKMITNLQALGASGQIIGKGIYSGPLRGDGSAVRRQKLTAMVLAC